MAKDIQPGFYEAMVSDYGVTTSKKGAPLAMIRFNYLDDDQESKFISWYGSFASDKAIEITCEALAICGWSTNNPADLAKGKGSGVLDEKRTVQITIEADTYEGVTRMKVKYINEVGGAQFRNAIEHGEAVKLFAGINIKGTAAQVRQKYSKPIPNFAPNAKTTDHDDDLDAALS